MNEEDFSDANIAPIAFSGCSPGAFGVPVDGIFRFTLPRSPDAGCGLVVDTEIDTLEASITVMNGIPLADGTQVYLAVDSSVGDFLLVVGSGDGINARLSTDAGDFDDVPLAAYPVVDIDLYIRIEQTDARYVTWSASLDGGAEEIIRTEVISNDAVIESVSVTMQAYALPAADPPPVDLDNFLVRASCE